MVRVVEVEAVARAPGLDAQDLRGGLGHDGDVEGAADALGVLGRADDVDAEVGGDEQRRRRRRAARGGWRARGRARPPAACAACGPTSESSACWSVRLCSSASQPTAPRRSVSNSACSADALGVEPELVVGVEHPQVGQHLALVGQQRRVAAAAGDQRLDVVGDLAGEQLLGLRPRERELAALGAVDERDLLGQEAVGGCGFARRWRPWVEDTTPTCPARCNSGFRCAIISTMATITRRRALAALAPLLGAGAASRLLSGEAAAQDSAGRRRSRPQRACQRARPLGARGLPARRSGSTTPATASTRRDRARLRRGHDAAPGQRPRPARVGARRPREGDRGRARRRVRRLDLQRPRARARAARARGRAAAHPLPQRLASPAHDPLPRHPPVRHGRRARARRRATSSPAARPSTSSTPSRSACTSTTATPTPLAEHIAKGLYGAFIIDPKEGRARRRRARDGDERVRHELRPRQRGLRGQQRRRSPTWTSRSRSQRGELVRIYLVNVLEFDLINSFHLHANFFDYYPTGTRSSRATSPTRSCRARASAGSSSCASRTWQVHVPRPRVRVRRAGLDGLLRGLRRRERQARLRPPAEPDGAHADARPLARRSLPAWLLGLVPLLLAVGVLGAFAALGGPGLERSRGPPVEELAVERTVLRARARSS